MPLPQPGQSESKDDFIARCVPVLAREGKDNDQAVAICFSQWRDRNKDMAGKGIVIELEPNEGEAAFMSRCMGDSGMIATHADEGSRRAACQLAYNQGSGGKSVDEILLAAIKHRGQPATAFGYGIQTADRYVKSIQECVGSDLCYRYAATRATSFQDVLTKAAKTLTYANEDMVLKSIEYHKAASEIRKYDGVEVPKNTLMIFKHILTTPRKDRDGDVLRSQGAVVDPKMLLLWQHVHTLPIGKLLLIDEQNSKNLIVVSAIVDMNELCHDAAVMVDNEMGRFSHGFRALEFDEMKAADGSPGGFDVKRYEIMEESLVSVPSNVDADTLEVMLSLVEGGKLTSPLMKAYGAGIRERRALAVGGIQYKEKIGNYERTISTGNAADFETVFKTTKDADNAKAKQTDKAGPACACGGASCPSKEADEHTHDKAKAGDKEMICPECGGKMVNGECKDCGYEMEDKEDKGAGSHTSNKAGRVLSKANEDAIREAHDTIEELHDMSGMGRQQKAMCKMATGKLKSVLDTVAVEEVDKGQIRDITVEQAMSRIITGASSQQRSRMVAAIKALEEVAQGQKLVDDYRAVVGAS